MLFFIKYCSLLGRIMLASMLCMVIIGLHYFFIKRARLYFHMLKELKNSHLADKGHVAEQNCDTDMHSFAFKESLFLWPKECKRLFFLSLSIALFYAVFSTVKLAGWRSDVSAVFTVLFNFLSVCFLALAPLIGVLCIKLTGKLRKMMQQLEEKIVQQDAPLIPDRHGEKNDG
ncbi:hypothetical protein [Bartonella sp. ML69XJBT]|uniref:hypothetical protein n=2 Tax=unclassified Bartonella TaxID=2645622 RepID=UPI00236038C6